MEERWRGEWLDLDVINSETHQIPGQTLAGEDNHSSCQESHRRNKLPMKVEGLSQKSRFFGYFR